MLSNTVVVAQLVRASDCGSEGRGFESLLPPHFEFLRGGGLLRQFYCAFFVPTSPPLQPRIYKAPAPYPTTLPILKSESNSQKPPAFKTHKSRKNRRILEKSRGSLTSGNSSCLKCKPQTVYPQNPNSFFIFRRRAIPTARTEAIA